MESFSGQFRKPALEFSLWLGISINFIFLCITGKVKLYYFWDLSKDKEGLEKLWSSQLDNSFFFKDNNNWPTDWETLTASYMVNNFFSLVLLFDNLEWVVLALDALAPH